jgi:ammonia channel protein AmtB
MGFSIGCKRWKASPQSMKSTNAGKNHGLRALDSALLIIGWVGFRKDEQVR